MTSFLNLKLFGLQIFNCEGSSLEFPVEKLEWPHMQDIGLFGFNFIGRKNKIFIKTTYLFDFHVYYNIRLDGDKLKENFLDNLNLRIKLNSKI